LGNLLGTKPREIKDPVELTSRIASAEIPNNLKAIEVAFPAKHAVDVLVATNMISVGVDIDRLGLMVVMGQPQATAEYIQATSRVGRRYPGLVLTLFNSGRSRDRSHYENFLTYHQALYRQVDSSSVTPFSPRARDRALHAVLIALARLLGTKYRPNASASDIATLDRDLQRVKPIILARASKVLSGDAQELKNIEAEFQGLVNRWKTEVEEHRSLLFAKYKSPRESLLVEAYEQHPDASGKFKTLRSLRDVDKTSDLYLVRI
jgi:superfamily II DNA/RNA helicase